MLGFAKLYNSTAFASQTPRATGRLPEEEDLHASFSLLTRSKKGRLKARLDLDDGGNDRVPGAFPGFFRSLAILPAGGPFDSSARERYQLNIRDSHIPCNVRILCNARFSSSSRGVYRAVRSNCRSWIRAFAPFPLSIRRNCPVLLFYTWRGVGERPTRRQLGGMCQQPMWRGTLRKRSGRANGCLDALI